jgi:hypothetical protein
VDRAEPKKHLGLIERAVEDGQLVIKNNGFLSRSWLRLASSNRQPLAALTRLLKAQRDLEDSRDELRKAINS